MSPDPAPDPSPDPSYGIRLRRTKERSAEIDRLAGTLGERVGIAGVLADLNREAARTRVPARGVEWGFRWGRADERSRRWWPQGITTGEPDDLARHHGVSGRRLLVTSWYAKPLRGEHRGSRISIVDLDSLAYRHVLLVVPESEPSGEVGLRPLRVHAGGLSWHGPFLHVAATARGFYTCHMDDLVRLRSGERTFGYRYVLPVRFRYAASADQGLEKMRYSFLSVERHGSRPALVAAEYGRDAMSRRFVRFPLDPGTGHLLAGADGVSVPTFLAGGGPVRMQGVVVVDGTWFVAASRGRYWPGTLHVGRPGEFRRFPLALPIGPEDLDHSPSTDLLWSITEYPDRRYVLALPRSRFTRP